MRLPALSAVPQWRVRTVVGSDAGVTPQFCTPCILGKQLCCSIFPPGCSIQDCGGGGGFCTPCLPFIHKKICFPGGIQDC
jgi:hypothetical protein